MESGGGWRVADGVDALCSRRWCGTTREGDVDDTDGTKGGNDFEEKHMYCPAFLNEINPRPSAHVVIFPSKRIGRWEDILPLE